MDILKQTKQLCDQYQIKPARSRGQNFLIAEKIYQKIIEAAELKSSDVILEVGPGFGFLTELLAKRVKKVIAVEVDDKLMEIVQKRFEELKIENVYFINADILKFQISNFKYQKNFKFQVSNYKEILDTKYQIPNTSYKIVANLPYNITSRFLRKFLSEVENKPSEMVLMLQQEVAERICAEAGQMSLLAVSAQFYATPKIIARVPASDFWPSPKVDSAIISLKVKRYKVKSRDVAMPRLDEEKFFKLIKAGFSAKRKQLAGNLIKNLKIKREEITKILADCGLKETVRAQELSLDDWRKLFVVLDRQNML